MSFELPPIVKQAQRLLLDIELAVRQWPRYHKYAHGAELRAQARQVLRLAHQAWRHRDDRGQRIRDLSDAVDELKLSLQIGKELQAFTSFRQFEAIARVAAELGRQCGGWRKQQRAKGQNEPASPAPAQRPQILSARGASTFEAQP